eukprot:m.243924 g.243924  ORF g.243924 m.243924 type:complete len:60 (+) comp10951_c3_seq13:3-182(+)
MSFKPRVVGASLGSMSERTVTLVGEVVRSDGSSAVIKAADGVDVTVNFEQPVRRVHGHR